MVLHVAIDSSDVAIDAAALIKQLEFLLLLGPRLSRSTVSLASSGRLALGLITSEQDDTLFGMLLHTLSLVGSTLVDYSGLSCLAFEARRRSSSFIIVSSSNVVT